MIARLIAWSVGNRLLVLIGAALLAAWGVVSLMRTPLDAIPDLSDVQVIVKTPFPGQSPRVVEDQVTYPLTTTMMSVPGAKAVRGYSFFGDSFVYVLFQDGTDPYWARSRVLEYLSQVQARLPANARPAIGPDATGVGWVYEYALTDPSGRHDIAQLRALQDWFLKYELKSVVDVAEVATVGGMVRQYQVVLDPDRMRALRISQERVVRAIREANRETGGSVLEMGEAEYMVRATGYLKSVADFHDVPLGVGPDATPVFLRDVASVQTGPEMRRGIAELDGEGEVVGGIIVMRAGGNALRTIEAAKARLEQLQGGLPEGVRIVPVYDRSQLIHRAVDTLREKLIEEFVVVALVCLLFLWHLRSALVAVVTLPLGVLMAFIVMRHQGIAANIMSLGGIAIAIGAMVDAAVVMVENAHKKLESGGAQAGDAAGRLRLIVEAATEVGPALFFSLLIITLSFVPVFTLEAQEGRLFAPLAFTKTYAMAAAAGLSVTLVPVLMAAFIRGHITPESRNPVNALLIRIYRPLLTAALSHPYLTLIAALAVLVSAALPLTRLGSEFMPALDEGDLLYMPSALPGISASKAAQTLQITDRIIKQFPEVKTVFGKIGRADTATDPAPLEMVETTLQFHPRERWRPGLTPETLIAQMNSALKIPGLANLWVQPIRNRIDMLATGIKSPVGIKIAGPDIGVIDQLATRIEGIVRSVPGAGPVLAERLRGGRYIDIDIERAQAARYGLSIGMVQDIVAGAIGGENIGETVEGLQRFPINVRYPRELRDNLEALRRLPIVMNDGQIIPLGEVARISISDGPPMLRSENARLAGWVYVDVAGRDLGGFVAAAQAAVRAQLPLPAGYSVGWSGQFEYLQRAAQRMQVVVPFTLAIIFVLLFLTFRSVGDAVLIMATLPLALVGGLWLLYALGHAVSVASAVGFVALAGVAAEFGVVMLLYLNQAVARRQAAGTRLDITALHEAIMEGAVQRVRPKAMTVVVIVAGLLPIMLGHGTGSEVMQRIAAPMVGGMITAPLLSMFVLPVVYLLVRGRGAR